MGVWDFGRKDGLQIAPDGQLFQRYWRCRRCHRLPWSCSPGVRRHKQCDRRQVPSRGVRKLDDGHGQALASLLGDRPWHWQVSAHLLRLALASLASGPLHNLYAMNTCSMMQLCMACFSCYHVYMHYVSLYIEHVGWNRCSVVVVAALVHIVDVQAVYAHAYIYRYIYIYIYTSIYIHIYLCIHASARICPSCLVQHPLCTHVLSV